MRVAHILPWPTIGGVEHGALRAARAARDSGIESVAFHLRQAWPVERLFRADGFSTASYGGIDPSIRHFRAFLSESLRMAAEFRRLQIDVVHCADLLAGYYAGLAGRLAGLPVMCHVRCSFPSISARDRLFLRPVSRWVFVSRSSWQEFGVRVSPSRGTVLYDAVETVDPIDATSVSGAVRAELGLPADALLVGMVARVAPAKDYATLGRAAVSVVARVPRAHFIIIGDNSGTESYRQHYAEVMQFFESLGIARRFTFTGFRTDVARLIAACDISALVTHTEGLPLGLLEAMSLGKPIVATAIGGIPEIVKDGATGLLHAHEDCEELSAAIIRLLTDQAAACALGDAGLADVKTRFGPARFQAELVDEYRKVTHRLGSKSDRS